MLLIVYLYTDNPSFLYELPSRCFTVTFPGKLFLLTLLILLVAVRPIFQDEGGYFLGHSGSGFPGLRVS
jgi:hypothetical protein